MASTLDVTFSHDQSHPLYADKKVDLSAGGLALSRSCGEYYVCVVWIAAATVQQFSMDTIVWK